jgi:acyl-CoA dehydrogenase
VGIVGEGLVAPTLVHFASPEQQQRFLPGILSGTEFWCQGYSEPDAGSDLANLSTRAELDGDEWVINGQKVWTSLAHISDWCFVLCRTDREAPRHRGISYLLIDMEADGIEIRPIRQITGHSEFSEVYYTDARTPADLIVGEVNGGWKVAMGTLAFERSTLTLGQQLEFLNQYEAIIETAKSNGAIADPVVRQDLMAIWTQLQLMRWNTLRTLSVDDNAELNREAMIGKLFWASLHRRMGELAVEVAGAQSLTTEQAPGYEPNADQRLFLYTRADTIYGGSNEIQRNIIGERALGLPREPR